MASVITSLLSKTVDPLTNFVKDKVFGDIADLANSVYPASSAALGGACPALSVVPKISRNLVAYLAGLIVVTPLYPVHRAGCRYPAAGLGEVHADDVLKIEV